MHSGRHTHTHTLGLFLQTHSLQCRGYIEVANNSSLIWGMCNVTLGPFANRNNTLIVFPTSYTDMSYTGGCYTCSYRIPCYKHSCIHVFPVVSVSCLVLVFKKSGHDVGGAEWRYIVTDHNVLEWSGEKFRSWIRCLIMSFSKFPTQYRTWVTNTIMTSSTLYVTSSRTHTPTKGFLQQWCHRRTTRGSPRNLSVNSSYKNLFT